MYGDDLLGDPRNIEEEVEEALYLENGGNEYAEADEEDGADGADPTSEATHTDDKPAEPKKKRVVQRPQPKLNPERLTGPRGIATLEDVFKDFKFLGKGYEKEDLDQVMKRLEHWCHRLYPRFQFDDCLEKIEALGHKKPVMTYVKKIRMGMVTADEPVILQDDIENEPTLDDKPPIDEFDALISQQLSAASPHPPQHSSGPTAEQRERMLRNRRLAEERRLARMKAQKEKEMSSENCSQSATTGSKVDVQFPAKSSGLVLEESSQSGKSSQNLQVNVRTTESSQLEKQFQTCLESNSEKVAHNPEQFSQTSQDNNFVEDSSHQKANLTETSK